MDTLQNGSEHSTRTASRLALLWIGPEAAGLSERIQLECGVRVEVAGEPAEALTKLRSYEFDLLVANFPIPDWSASELLEEIQRITDLAPVIIRDPSGRILDAVRMVKLGAHQYFGDGCSEEQFMRTLKVALEERRSLELVQLSRSVETGWKELLVGESRGIRDVERLIRLVACRRCTVLITGETGTGKEVVARALHMAGNRSRREMVCVNCSAIPEELLESELFGHTKGAFTGAVAQRIGRFEQAHGSTLFLDEIGDMPVNLQAKLLRALQEREIQRLGSSETVKVDVRVIAASNVNLPERIKEGQFREDLFYRLNVVPIKLPPLRERLCDIPLLVHYFIDKICRAEDIPMKKMCRESLDRLCDHNWPGNVRELENAVEMAVILSGDRAQLYPSDFPLPASHKGDVPVLRLPDGGLQFEQAVAKYERSILEEALKRTGGNKTLAAEMLCLPRTTLVSKLRALETQQA